MSKVVIVNKSNRKEFMDKMGVFQIMKDGKPVLKNNGKPWAGRTKSMGNYYGIIVGGQKYLNVKQRGAWTEGCEIYFTEMTPEEFKKKRHKQDG